MDCQQNVAFVFEPLEKIQLWVESIEMKVSWKVRPDAQVSREKGQAKTYSHGNTIDQMIEENKKSEGGHDVEPASRRLHS